MVDDATIAGMLANAPASQQACETLVQCALDNGGRDNVTVIVAGYELPHQT
jgi:PPM family protein phosphatase